LIDQSSSLPLNSIIQNAIDDGSGRFDPVRFRYIESMAKRAERQKGQVNRVVEEKVLEALEKYWSDLERAKADAELRLVQIEEAFPEQLEEAQRLFDAAEYKALLNARRWKVTDKPSSPRSKESLADIIVQLSSSSGFAMEEDSTEVLGSGHRELKSLKLYREYLGRISSDTIVTRAIKESPENAGPLNPQRLIIRSLSSMRDLSPAYLNRLVSYFDSVLSLAQLGELTSSSASQKVAGTAKSKRTKRK